MNKDYLEMPLENLCAKILFDLEAASDGLLSADIAGSAHDRAVMARWAARVRGGGGLRHGVSATITPILALLQAEMDEETRGYRNVFEGHLDTEEGPVGHVVRRRFLTERGERIRAWHDGLRRLRHMLQVAEARLDAERAVNRRMAR
ncbi:hypothetical protein [Roseivivax isoporae]|uniref:Uncharacterized protein n=1 Tax=Roseivivax isoporae LMG 25204 TaxID=1449351 RepID=X7FD93_9RHOB|nr:hypothetical protein [Roseivivax isoporae]ETX30790.1 hypothetical protein RISW2_07165 [Roseivivax isoporae LMG 25204]